MTAVKHNLNGFAQPRRSSRTGLEQQKHQLELQLKHNSSSSKSKSKSKRKSQSRSKFKVNSKNIVIYSQRKPPKR
jgi:hypothetical protein